jgi:RNA polymerase sigma-70 factor (ECF subfamily)
MFDGARAVGQKCEMENTKDDIFIQRFVQNQSRLYRFIAALAPNRTDAEELFQEASLAAWNARERFEADRDMFPWLSGIARNLLKSHYRKQKRQANALDPALLDQLCERLAEESDILEVRLEALSDCLQKLPPRHREFVQNYYREHQTVKGFAVNLNLNEQAAYKTLQRIRSALRNCIEKSISPASLT